MNFDFDLVVFDFCIVFAFKQFERRKIESMNYFNLNFECCRISNDMFRLS